MALPPRDQRHQYLRCYMEAQGFCSGDRVCLLAELGGGYLRLEAHWCMSSFWSSLVLSDSKRVFLIRILLRLYLFQLGGARRACVKAVILCTWDYFPTAKRRWRLLDMVYTRLIACSIAGRSQASEKAWDLIYMLVIFHPNAELVLLVMDGTNGEAYDKVFNHLDMLHAPLEGNVLILTTAKFVEEDYATMDHLGISLLFVLSSSNRGRLVSELVALRNFAKKTLI
ncbi:hypothetical protein Tco_1078223 [Tanacetum coccineum]